MIKINNALSKINNLAFDTAPIIYFIEANPLYDVLVTNIFDRVSRGEILGFTSVLTLTEVLIHPLRKKDSNLHQAYRTLLTKSSYFIVKIITAEIAERAAELRAKYNLRTPDALQVATAIDVGCDAFLINDNGLKKVIEINVLILDDLEL